MVILVLEAVHVYKELKRQDADKFSHLLGNL